MKIEKIPSYTIDLGPVDTEWANTELPYDASVKLKYASHDEDSQRTYPLNKMQLIYPLGAGREEGIEGFNDIGDNLRSVTQDVDEKIRDYRGIPAEEQTEVTVDFRSGRARALSMTGLFLGKMQQMFKLPYRISPPGLTHIDRRTPSTGSPEEDSIIVCHGGTPTTAFEGPVYNLLALPKGGDSVGLMEYPLTYVQIYSGALSKLTAPLKTTVPLDHAVIFTEDTLHRQSAQVERVSSPAYFLRFIVAQVEGDSQNEASAS